MDSRTAKGIQEIAGQNQRLAALLRAASAFETLEKHVLAEIGEESRDQIRVACVEGDTLVLSVQTPAWASRARLEAAGLLRAARSLWPTELRHWRVIVQAEKAF